MTDENAFKNYLRLAIDSPNLEKGKEHLTASADCFFAITARELQGLGVKPEHLVHFLMTAAFDVLDGDTDALLKAALTLHQPLRG